MLLLLLLPMLGWAQSPNIVISQVYTAGGNSNATYNQDFVELFNRSASPVTITGWTIQYASATGLFSTNTPYVITTATIPARGYYLIGIGAPTAGVGNALSIDQPSGSTVAISSGFAVSGGKVALANNTATITYTAPGTFSANVVDVVGYGTANAYEGASPAPAPTNTTSAIVRAGNGCTDTNNNGTDFTVSAFANGATVPRNSSTAVSNCTNPVLVANPSTLSFAAPLGQVATVATYVVAGFNLSPNAPITISSTNAAVLVSPTGAAGSFASTATITTTASGTLTQTISVQFMAPATAGTTTATLSNSGSGLTASVAVTGAAITAYTWNGSSTSFSNSSSWTPARPAPTPGSADVLLFDGSVTPTTTVALDYTSTQTIGQLQFINNVTATLSTDDNRTLTVDGNIPGDDFLIRAGSTVTVAHGTSVAATSGLTGLTIALTSLETASIGGTLIFTGYPNVANGRHTLQATGTEVVQFLSGSRFQATNTYTGASPFGNASFNAGSVVFRNGSRFEQAGGSTPFGTTTPAVAAFEPASLFLFSATSSAPSLAGRTYGTLVYDVSGGSTASGMSGQATVQGDLLVRNGMVSISGTGGISVLGNVQVANAASLTLATTGPSALQGNIEVNNTATLSVAPASAATLQLNGTAAQTLGGTSTAATPIAFTANATLQINNAAGVGLGMPLALPGTLQLTSGLLTTSAANSLLLGANPQGGSNTSFVNGPVIRPVSTAGTYVFPVSKGVSFRPITLNVSAQNGTTYYRAEQLEGNPGQNVTGSNLTRVSKIRSFTITPFASVAEAAAGTATQPSGFTGTVTLNFGSNDGVTDPSQLVIAKRPNSSSPWTNAGYTTGSATASTVTSGVINSFSDFALGFTGAESNVNPLPVVLTSFAAMRQASGRVQMRWTTASERHSAYFEVQRSRDGSSFVALYKVAAQGTTAQAHTYASLDAEAPAGQLYYRLRQIDSDGTEAFSPVVVLVTTSDVSAPSLYPNPAQTQLTVSFAAGEQVQVLDLTGRVLQTTTLPDSGQLAVATLPAGTYLLRVVLKEQPRPLRFIKE